jgi:hypothetical protein
VRHGQPLASELFRVLRGGERVDEIEDRDHGVALTLLEGHDVHLMRAFQIEDGLALELPAARLDAAPDRLRANPLQRHAA